MDIHLKKIKIAIKNIQLNTYNHYLSIIYFLDDHEYTHRKKVVTYLATIINR